VSPEPQVWHSCGQTNLLGVGVSDIGLNWGPGTTVAFALLTGAPGLVLGCLIGALAWRAHRFWGGVLGAILGLALNLAIFSAWADSAVSVSIDYHAALVRGLLRSLPGLVVGAGLGAWLWRGDRLAGGACGAPLGAALWLGVWLMLGGGL
jgi:hypothetical protein